MGTGLYMSRSCLGRTSGKMAGRGGQSEVWFVAVVVVVVVVDDVAVGAVVLGEEGGYAPGSGSVVALNAEACHHSGWQSMVANNQK